MTSTWTIVEPTLPALTFTYSFGPGTANALALVVGGGVVVVSAPCDPPESAFTELEKYGPVRALVAPNAYHNMGIPAWKGRYPGAAIFAPERAIPRVQKQTKRTDVRPVTEMAELLGDRVEIFEMPHYKMGEVLVRWRAGDSYAWYVTDVAMNWPEMPKGIFGTIMKWTKSAPGFRRNAIAGAFMVKDKRALYAWIQEQAEKTPPSLVVNCHGVPAQLSDPQAGIRAAFA